MNLWYRQYHYNFSVFADKERTIDVNFSSVFGIGNSNKREIFSDLVRAAELYIFPTLVKKYVLYVDKNPEPLKIGNLLIGRNGLTKKGLFKKSDFLDWEYFTNSDIKKGQIYIYKLVSQGKQVVFAKVSLRFYNAILLPALLGTLKNSLVN